MNNFTDTYNKKRETKKRGTDNENSQQFHNCIQEKMWTSSCLWMCSRGVKQHSNPESGTKVKHESKSIPIIFTIHCYHKSTNVVLCQLCVLAYMCMYACVCACVHVHACMHVVCVYVHLCVSVSLCVHVIASL